MAALWIIMYNNCGQCGEVVKGNFVKKMYYTCGPCGEVARCKFEEIMVQQVVGNVGRW